jgi:hypothetical protein
LKVAIVKKCDFNGEQEKCGNYEPRSKDDWTCDFLRKNFLGIGCHICNGEYPEKPKIEEK